MKQDRFFLGLGATDVCQTTPKPEFKPQYTVKTVKHGGAASWYGDVSANYVLGLFIAFQGSWISLKYIKNT